MEAFQSQLETGLDKEGEYGSQILASLEKVRRFNLWMGRTLAPYVGDRVLEIGAGIGTLTGQFIPRECYLASDINPSYISYLRSYSIGKPYLRVQHIDAGVPTILPVLRSNSIPCS